MAEVAEKIWPEELEVPPEKEEDARQAWQNRPRPARSREAIRPTPSLPFNPGQKAAAPGSSSVLSNGEEGAQVQKSVAERLRQLRRHRQIISQQAQEAKSAMTAGTMRQRYEKIKKIRNIMRVAKIGTSLSLVGIIVALLLAHGEWLYQYFWDKNYPFSKWDKYITVIADIIVAVIILGLVVLLYFTQIAPFQFILEAL